MLTACAISSPVVADSLADALRLLPPDTVGAIVVPDLKRANDEFTLCLERMDRPEAFFVGRPIDLVKARSGMSVGVRDTGAVVAALRWPEHSDAPLPLLFMPVSDASAFIAGNFVSDEGRGDGLRNARGEIVHALDLGRWVAIAPDRSALDDLRIADVADVDDATALRRLHDRLGDRARSLLVGEVLAWIDGAALRRFETATDLAAMLELGDAPANADDAPWSQWLRGLAGGLGDGLGGGVGGGLAGGWHEGLDIAAMSINLDALGIMLHGALRFDDESEIGSALRRPASAARSLSRLPDNAPYWALSIDLAALRPFLPIAFPEGTIDDRTRAIVDGVTSMQWGCWPSRLGVAVGGILNDSSLLLQTAEPEALRLAMLDFIEASAGEHDGVLIEPQVERDRTLRSGGSADAFEVRETPLPESNASIVAIRNGVRSALFGNRGVHGLVRTVPDGVVVTFSQRPDVLGRAVEAGVSAPAMDASAVVAAMREFMVDRPIVEGYLGVGEIARVARQLAGAFGTGAAGVVPTIDAGSEPIGMAISIDDGTLLGSTVIPAGVLGAMLDQAQRMR